MANVNNVVLTGKINYAPKMFNTAKGGKMASFVLNTYLSKGKDGKYNYGNFSVKVFDNDMAEFVEKLGENKPVIVVGRLNYETYKNKEGNDVNTVSIIADTVAPINK